MPAIRPLVKTADGLWIRQWAKGPNEVEGYGVGWLQILGPDDFIVDSEFIVSSPELVEVSHRHTRTMSVWWGSGGVLDSSYEITHRITSDTGRELEQTTRLFIVKK